MYSQYPYYNAIAFQLEWIDKNLHNIPEAILFHKQAGFLIPPFLSWPRQFGFGQPVKNEICTNL